VQLYTCLEDLDSLLPVEVVVADESSHAALEIMKPVLVVTTVTASLLVEVPIFCQFPDIIVIRSIVKKVKVTRWQK